MTLPTSRVRNDDVSAVRARLTIQLDTALYTTAAVGVNKWTIFSEEWLVRGLEKLPLSVTCMIALLEKHVGNVMKYFKLYCSNKALNLLLISLDVR